MPAVPGPRRLWQELFEEFKASLEQLDFKTNQGHKWNRVSKFSFFNRQGLERQFRG